MPTPRMLSVSSRAFLFPGSHISLFSPSALALLLPWDLAASVGNQKILADPKRWDECSWKGTSGAKKNQRLMSRSKVWNTKCGVHSCVSFLGWFSYAQTMCLMSNWLGDTEQAILFPLGSGMSCANSSSFRVWVRVHYECNWGQPTRENFRKTKDYPTGWQV